MQERKVEINDIDVLKELEISEDNLSESFTNQSAYYMYWSHQVVLAKSKLDKAKSKVEEQSEYIKKTLVGDLDAEVRERFKQDKVKTTETLVTNTIYAHPLYKAEVEKLSKLKATMLEVQEVYDSLNAVREAFEQRKDCLISYGALVREEMKNNSLHLNEK